MPFDPTQLRLSCQRRTSALSPSEVRGPGRLLRFRAKFPGWAVSALYRVSTPTCFRGRPWALDSRRGERRKSKTPVVNFSLIYRRFILSGWRDLNPRPLDPQVDGSAQILDFPGFSAPQMASFHVMDCMVCMHQVPARSRLLVGSRTFVRGLRGVYRSVMSSGLRSPSGMCRSGMIGPQAYSSSCRAADARTSTRSAASLRTMVLKRCSTLP